MTEPNPDPAKPLWTASEIAEFLGYTGTAAVKASSARATMLRWGVKPVRRKTGPGGPNLYRSAQVIAAFESRPRANQRKDPT